MFEGKYKCSTDKRVYILCLGNFEYVMHVMTLRLNRFIKHKSFVQLEDIVESWYNSLDAYEDKLVKKIILF